MPAEPLPVTNAAQAAARDAAAIAAGADSFALMLTAGTAIVEVILRRAHARLSRGVVVCAGTGNNGGDGYIVAVQLHRLGVPVSVWAAGAPRTADATRAAALVPTSLAVRTLPELPAAPGVVVDALLGTGAHGELREPVLGAASWIAAVRQRGAWVVAADVPTGVDASTGATAEGGVRADETVCLGTCKAGVLAARAHAGRVTVVDIGLGNACRLDDAAPQLADPRVMSHVVPPISWDAYKGTRGRVLLVGGARGMAGAMHLAARGALLSGAGLVRASVAWESQLALQAAVPEVVCLAPERRTPEGSATTGESGTREPPPESALALAAREWAHAIVLGPGLGRDGVAADRLVRTLRGAALGSPALVIDADALMLLASGWADGSVGDAFRECVATHAPVVLTPHWGEFRALAAAVGVETDGVATDLQARLAALREVAAAYGATMLLKGTPTICCDQRGRAWVVPRGAPTLASGGSGDVLSGVLGALLAGVAASNAGRPPDIAAEREADVSPDSAAECAAECAAVCAAGAWVHGVAGELLAARTGGLRGTTISDVVHALPAAWRAWATPAKLPPRVLLELPAPEGDDAQR